MNTDKRDVAMVIAQFALLLGAVAFVDRGLVRTGLVFVIGLLLGLLTVIYHVSDLRRAKTWYADAFGVKPYFDEPFYVGFNIGGFELGLDPDAKGVAPGAGGSVAYWRVPHIDAAVQHFTQSGATIKSSVQDVGGDIRVAIIADPFGNLIGLIETPDVAAA